MNRKPTKTTRGPNAAEKLFQGWCKERDCCTCGNPGPSIVHHCEGATFRHKKVLVGHWFCIPLCQSCDDVITRGSRRAFRETYGPQSKLWLEQVFNYSQDMSGTPQDIINAIEDWSL